MIYYTLINIYASNRLCMDALLRVVCVSK
jgi:hypothetical protein